MSRSGTSMLMRMLDELGLFVGEKLTRNHESVFFRKINDWLLTQTSGGLENPETIKYLLRDKEARGLYGDFVRFSMTTPEVILFLGFRKYLRVRSPLNLDVPWGWKDPRNTFTLPFWLDLFPDARVIHIYRHPLDIANSLITRRKRGLSRLTDRHKKLRPFYWYYLVKKFLMKNRLFVDIRGGTLEEGFAIWEEYLKEARSHVNALEDRAMEVKYEEFLENPRQILRTLADFCGLEATQEQINKTASQANKSRAYAYRSNLELEEFSKKISDNLKSYGY